MNRQAFRSACSVARSEGVLSTPTPVSFFRSFSTTPSVLAEENSNSGSQPSSNPRPSAARQRGRAAASQINKFAASRPPVGVNGSNPASFAGGPGNQPKVLDIRSVPAGLGRGRGRGGLLRGRGGANNTARSTSPAGGAAGNRFSGAGRGGVRGGARGSFRGGAGPTRGGTRGGARGGRGGGRGGRKGEGADKKDNNAGGGGRRKDPFEVMDPAEQEFDNAMRFGTTTTYNPSITLEDLAQFAPAVPTSSAGRRATVLQNLSLLGGSEQVATPRNYQVSDAAAQLSKAGARFFADATQKTAAEMYLQSKPVAEGQEAPAVQPVEDAIRQTITEQAVKGTHEAPKFASNWREMMHSTFLRSESYKAKDMTAFEKKVAALAGKVEAAKPAAKKPAAEKKASKAKAKAA